MNEELTFARITSGILLVNGSFKNNSSHSHHAVQICIGINEEVTISIDNTTVSSQIILIDSNISHKLKNPEIEQLLILIEPELVYGHSVQHLFPDNGYISRKTDRSIIKDINDSCINRSSSLPDILQDIFSLIDIPLCYSHGKDKRIEKAITIIDQLDIKKISIPDLADSVFLSESRLQHLFREQTGISIKKYLLWKKMLDAVKTMTLKKDLTNGAMSAGFSDSAHLSKTFRNMFGIKPRDIFKDSRSIQVKFE